MSEYRHSIIQTELFCPSIILLQSSSPKQTGWIIIEKIKPSNNIKTVSHKIKDSFLKHNLLKTNLIV